MEMRNYQTEAIASARKAIARGAKKVLVICPTGGGKTVIAAEIINSAVAKGTRSLFLAHRRELITQTCDKLHRFGVRHGVIMGDHRTALHLPVQVASVQTLARRPGVLNDVGLVFLDEAHHVTTENQYAQVLAWYPNARAVGLTATPWRLDGRGLADVFDSYVLARTPAQLRDEGYLSPVGGWEYEAIDTSQARVKGGDFLASDLQAAATSRRVVGDIIGEWQRFAAGKRTVLFACSVSHSQLMAAEFCRAGVAAEHVDGTMPVGERDQVIERLRSGETLVITNCNVVTEGFDCPELEVAILARPTLSTSLALQMIGRILRPAAGKAMARIHDHAGILAAHGHPYADRDYSPTVTLKAKRKDLEEGKERAKRCPSCKSVLARWPCDACGYSPKPQELKLEYEEAQRKAIENAAAAVPNKEQLELNARRERWSVMSHQDKYEFFLRMAAKHGPKRAKGVYRWFSGELEWPRRAWSEGWLDAKPEESTG